MCIERVDDIPFQNICEIILAYDLFGCEDGACKDSALLLSPTILCKSLWELRMGCCVRMHCDAYIAVVLLVA